MPAGAVTLAYCFLFTAEKYPVLCFHSFPRAAMKCSVNPGLFITGQPDPAGFDPRYNFLLIQCAVRDSLWHALLQLPIRS